MAKTILIVDDNAHIRQTICEAFKRESDLEVCGEAENGKGAIDKALALHPDLIVLDLSMPEMNGLDAARELKTGCLLYRYSCSRCMLIRNWRRKLAPLAWPMWSQNRNTSLRLLPKREVFFTATPRDHSLPSRENPAHPS